MTQRFLVLALAFAAAGCATAPGERSVHGIAGDLLRAHVRADRAALAAAGAMIGSAFGYPHGKFLEGRIAQREADAIRSESGLNAALTLQSVPYRDESGRSRELPVMQSIQMEVRLEEMITPEGTLHPRAAQALARMDNMARESGGDFSVFVPRSQLQIVDAIKFVAPGATIFPGEDAEHYRLSVVAAAR